MGVKGVRAGAEIRTEKHGADGGPEIRLELAQLLLLRFHQSLQTLQLVSQYLKLLGQLLLDAFKLRRHDRDGVVATRRLLAHLPRPRLGRVDELLAGLEGQLPLRVVVGIPIVLGQFEQRVTESDMALGEGLDALQRHNQAALRRDVAVLEDPRQQPEV